MEKIIYLKEEIIKDNFRIIYYYKIDNSKKALNIRVTDPCISVKVEYMSYFIKDKEIEIEKEEFDVAFHKAINQLIVEKNKGFEL